MNSLAKKYSARYFPYFVNSNRIEVKMRYEQSLALNAAVNGHNLLICGQAETGKTHTIKAIYKSLSKQRKVSLLCTTGMACLQYADYDAKTVHSWAGLYDGRYDLLTLKDLVLNDDKYENVRSNVKCADVEIVDC